MAKLTNAQLTAELEAVNAAYERLAAERETLLAEVARVSDVYDLEREDNEELRTEIKRLRAECAQLTEQLIAAEMRAPKPRAQYAAPADLTARRAAMEAAKVEAMRTGRSVRAW